jgi:hypothetical protein
MEPYSYKDSDGFTYTYDPRDENYWLCRDSESEDEQ